MYRFRKFLKGLGYSLVYLLISIASAYGVINLSISYVKGETQIDAEAPLPEQITSMVEHFSTSDAFDIDLTAVINSQADSYEIGLNALVDISQGIENIKAEGSLTAVIGSSQSSENATLSQSNEASDTIEVDFSYQNGTIYLEMLSGKFVMQSANLMDSLSQILAVANIDLESMGVSEILNMPINDMLQMLSNIKEETYDEKTGLITMVIALPMVGDATVVCDSTYKLQGIYSDMAISEGMSVKVSSDIQYPEETVIQEKNEDEYLNAGNLLEVINPVLQYIKNTEFAMDINVTNQKSTGEYQTIANGKLYLDVANTKAKLSLQALGNEANLYLIDNVIYLEYQNVFTKFAFSDFDKVQTMLETTFNIVLPQEVIDTINGVVSGEEITLPNGMDMSSLDINNLDLSIIEKVENKNNSTIITIRDIGIVRIATDGKNLTELAYSGFGYQAVVRVIDYQEFDLATEKVSYIDLTTFIPTIENAINIASFSSIQGKIEAVYNDQTITVDFAYSPALNIAKAQTEILGLGINIFYQNDKVYVNVADKFKFITNTTTFIDDILSFLTKIDVDFSQTGSSALTEKFAVLFDPSITPLFITSLEETTNGFILTFFNDTEISLENASNEINISSAIANVGISAKIMGCEEEITAQEINEQDYTNTNEVMNLIAKVYNSGITKLITPAINTLSSNNIGLDLTVEIEGFSLPLNVNLSLVNKSLSLTTTFYELDFALLYQGETIFIEYGNIYLSFALADFNRLDSFLSENFGITLPSQLIGKMIDVISGKQIEINDIIEYLNFDLSNINPAIFDNIKVDNTKATVTVGENIFSINYTFDKIVGFDIAGQINASAEIVGFEEVSLSTGKSNYIDATALIPTMENILAVANSEKIYGKLIFTLDEEVINVTFSYDALTNKAVASTEIMGININIYYTDNKVFINVEDKFKFVADATTFISDLQSFLEKSNIDITAPETNKILNAVITMLSPSVNPALVKSFTQTASGLVVTLFNDITFAITNGTDEIAFNSAFDNGSIFAVLKVSKQDVVLPEINQSQYTNTNVVLDIVSTAYNKGLANLITPALNTFTSTNFGLKINLTVGETNIPAELYFSIEDRSLAILSSLNNTSLNIFYQDETFFVEYGNLYFQAKLASYPQVEQFLEDNFGITLPGELITKVIEMITADNISFEDMLNSFDYELNLAEFDLDFFNNICVTENKASIALGDYSIAINYTADKIVGFEFNGNSATITDYVQTNLSSEKSNYIDLTSFLPSIENALAIMENDVISGSINATIEGQEIAITFAYSQSSNTASAYTQVYGININIYMVENNVFVNVHDKFKFVSNTSTFLDDIKTFLTKVGVDSTVDTDAILAEVANILNPAINSLLVKSFSKTENNLVVTLFNDTAINLVNGENKITISSEIENIPFSIIINGGNEMPTIPTIIESEYMNTNVLLDIVAAAHNAGLTNLLAPAIDTLGAGNFGATFDFAYEDVSVNGHFSINVADLSVGINVNIRGVDVNIITLSDDVIYVEFGNLYVKFALADLPEVGQLIEKHFDLALPFDKILEILSDIRAGSFNPVEVLNKFDINIDLASFDLAYFDSIKVENNSYFIPVESVGDFTIKADEKIQSFNYKGYGFETTAYLNEYKVFDLSLLKEEYIDITALLPTVDNILEIISYNTLSGQIVIYDSQLNLNAPIDYVISKEDEIYVNFTTNIYGANIRGRYYKEKVYLEFADSVKIVVDINELPTAIQEVMQSAGRNLPQSLLDIFDTILGIFFEGNTGSIISTAIGTFDRIKSIFNTTEIEMLIKNFVATESGFIITLYNDMAITLNNQTLQLNLATAIDYIDLDLSIKASNDNVTIPTLVDSDYIPIENILELVKAFFNMTHKDDFSIKGTLNIVGTLIGIDIKMNVDVEAQVKIVDDKVQFQAIIGEIPAIVGVNNDVPYKFGDTESGSDRYVYLYFDGGDLYIYRHEYVDIMFGASKREYEKCTKVSIDTLLADPMYYLQYMLGFKDSIMTEIKEAMLLAQNRENPINLNNVVNTLACNGDNFDIVLNLAEIANNDLMDTLDLGLLLNKDNENKSYIYQLALAVLMPLAENVFELDISSNNITLINYGSTVDLSRLQNYVTNYKYNYGEEWEASNGDWGKSGDKQYTIYFEENGGDEQTNITGVYGSAIKLPTYTNSIVTDDGVAKTTATFAGWYTTKTFKEGTLFTETTMPRRDTTLYAKWDKVSLYYRTIKFVTNSTDVINSITQLEGTTVVVPYLDKKEETIGDETTTYSFAGWYLDSACTEKFTMYKMPSQSIVLYAKWDIVKKEITKSFTLYDNTTVYSYHIKAGDKIDLSGIGKVVMTGDYPTLFYYDSAYTSQYTGEFIMPENDLTLHMKNAYTLTIYSQFGNAINSTTKLYQGEEFDLPTQQAQIIKDTFGVSKITYTFNGYKSNGNLLASDIMPNSDLYIVADWNVDTKYYYRITFSKDTDATGGYQEYISFSNNTTTDTVFLEGTKVNLANYTATWQYNPFGWWHHKFYGWSTSKTTSSDKVIPTLTITSNVTLYAVWSWDAKAGKG